MKMSQIYLTFLLLKFVLKERKKNKKKPKSTEILCESEKEQETSRQFLLSLKHNI